MRIRILPTVWNQLEGAMAFQMELPLLLLKESKLSTEGILDLLTNAFPRWEKYMNPLPAWKWKYIKPPLKPVIKVALDGNKIVGVLSEIVIQVKIGDKIHPTIYEDDTVIHPDFRGRGIYTKMLKDSLDSRREREIGLVYYSTDNPIISKTDQKIGYRKLPHSLSHLVKIYDIDAFTKKHRKDNPVIKLGLRALSILSGIKIDFLTKPNSVSNYSIKETSSFDESINTFWEEVKNGYDYIIEKKSDYLNWKIQRPGRQNIIRLAINQSRVLGYIIISLEKKDGDYLEGTIIDLLALPGRLDVAEALLKNACSFLLIEDAVAVYFPVTKGHPYGDLAKRHGFIDVSWLKTSFFQYIILNNKIDDFIIENLTPARVQLQYF